MLPAHDIDLRISELFSINLNLIDHLLRISVSAEFLIHEYIADEDENAAIIVFAVENEVREFSLDTLEFTGFDDNDNIQFKITDSYMYGTLTSERELAVQLLLEGTLPNYGISYLDSNGVMRHQYITMSGEDGSILLIEWE